MTMLRRKLDELSRTLGQRDSLDSRTLLATQVQLQQMVRLIEQEQARSLFEARVAGTRSGSWWVASAARPPARA